MWWLYQRMACCKLGVFFNLASLIICILDKLPKWNYVVDLVEVISCLYL